MRTNETDGNEVDLMLGQALSSEPPREVERRLRSRLAAFRDRLAGREAPTVRPRRLVPRWAIPIPVAAAVLVVLLLARSGGPAFAEVIAHVRAARTLSFTMTQQQIVLPEGRRQEMTAECMVMEPGRFRYAAPDGNVMVLDAGQGKGLMLNTEAKMAVLLSTKNGPAAGTPGPEFLEGLRALQGSNAEDLGRREIGGRKAVGFHVSGTSGLSGSEPAPTVDWTIWADAQTGLPIRVELGMVVAGFETSAVMSDFVFNPELDESLFSMDVPAGYALHQLDMDASEPTEADLLAALRQYTEMTGGAFPGRLQPAVSAADAGAQAAELASQIAAALARRAAQGEGGPSPELIADLTRASSGLARAAAFVSALPPESRWHYSSQGVRLGDAGKPLCWWRPAGSSTYRVVYGDLSVADVPEDALPAE